MMRLDPERSMRAEKGESSRVNDHVAVQDVIDVEETVTSREATRDMADNDRRILRSKYRELKSHLNDGKGKLGDPDGNFLDIVRRAEKLYAQVTKPREQIQDAELLNNLTNEVLLLAKDAKTKGDMSAADIVGGIIRTYGLPGSANGESSQSLDWEAFGLEACSVLGIAPGMSTMIGPMDVEVKARKTTGPRRRDEPTERTRPQEVDEADTDKPSTETDANMKTMFKILIERQQCQLDHLVLNRVSFAQTIENLFALSFLVKEGNVGLNFADNGKPVVVPRHAPAHADRATGEVSNTQFVFRLDFECWRLMQESVEEGMELMPHRARGEPALEIPAARTPIRKNSRNRARETPVVAPTGDSPEDNCGEGSSRRLKRKMI